MAVLVIVVASIVEKVTEACVAVVSWSVVL